MVLSLGQKYTGRFLLYTGCFLLYTGRFLLHTGRFLTQTITQTMTQKQLLPILAYISIIWAFYYIYNQLVQDIFGTLVFILSIGHVGHFQTFSL